MKFTLTQDPYYYHDTQERLKMILKHTSSHAGPACARAQRERHQRRPLRPLGQSRARALLRPRLLWPLLVLLPIVTCPGALQTQAAEGPHDALRESLQPQSLGVASLEPQPQQQQVAGSLVQAPSVQSQAQSQSQPQPQSQQAQRQFADIAVRPHDEARLECRLPPLVAQSNRTRQFYWNFQQTSTHVGRPELLCFNTNCLNAPSYNLELDFDQATGTYDLLIRNATYELNDGIYYCDYRDSSPETGRQTINREIKLTILIPPQPPSIAAVSPSPAREGQEHQLQCQTHGGNPEPNITWFKNELALLPGPGLRLEQSRLNGTTTSTLTWIPSVDDHQAVYKCSVTNKAMGQPLSYEREITLHVEYAPRISVGPYNPLKLIQGDRATLSCQVDANPPVKGIRWLRDGHQLLSNSYNHTIPELRVADAGVYACQADNGIAPAAAAVLLAAGAAGPGASGAQASGGFLSFLGLSSSSSSSTSSSSVDLANGGGGSSRTLVEARLQLEVLYAPRVQVRESRPQPLNEGDQFALNCSVESWPPAHEFVWARQEDEHTFRRLASSGPTLEFSALTASDMANYTCTAVNRLEPSGSQGQYFERSGSASLVLLVRHKPGAAEILLGQSGETELNNKTLIQCRARPPGYPEPRVQFWKLTTKGRSALPTKNQAGHTYQIFAATPENEGRYSCKVSNELGDSNEALGELVVNEPPQIGSGDHTWSRKAEQAPGHAPYAITVRASGKPEPRVRWFHRSPVDGRRVELSAAELEGRFKIETVSKPEPVGPASSGRMGGGGTAATPRPRHIVFSTLRFLRPLEVDDRGLYTVEFSNGLSRVATEGHQLHIGHAPIPAPRNLPVGGAHAGQKSTSAAGAAAAASLAAKSQGAIVTKWRAGVNAGETANLTCRVSAYPMPTFVWYYNPAGSEALDSNPRYHSSVANPYDDIWEGTLTFELDSQRDYGDYMCVTANQDMQTGKVSDSTSILIQLGQKAPPEAPGQLEQVDASQDSVTLAWAPGFDGGFPLNQFLVQLALDEPGGHSLMRRFGPMLGELGVDSNTLETMTGAGSIASGSIANAANGNTNAPGSAGASDQYPRLFDCQSANPCTISNLQPRQTYLMRVRARNELGLSEFSDELRVSTRANFSQIPRILEAYFEPGRNILHFRLEPNPEYLLNSLEARVEVRSYAAAAQAQAQQQQQQQVSVGAAGEQHPSYATDQQQQQQQQQHQQHPQQQQLGQQGQETADGAAVVAAAASQQAEWRRHLSVPMRHEQTEVYLNMSADIEALRVTLCSRTNEHLCGQEYLVSAQGGVASSFLQDQRSLSVSIFGSILFLIAVITLMATTVHSRCLSRKAKKAAALERADHHGHHAQADNKGHVNGGLSLANGSAGAGAKAAGSHGSTTSTNSTSATNGLSSHHAHQLASTDSINGGAQHLQGHLLMSNGGSGGLGANNNGSSSDHSSDHSRQAKLDSMLPPNYSHYADRASLMLEQQQQQQQQQQMAASAYHLPDKLGSPFGLPASALMGVHDPQVGDYFPANSMMLNSMLGNGYGGAQDGVPQDDPQQQQLYASAVRHQQTLDDFNNYNNALAYQTEQQIIESAYGTRANPSGQPQGAGGLMMAQPTQASYDNNANQSYLGFPIPSDTNDYDHHQHSLQQQQQQQLHNLPSDATSSQYQQDLAAAQQQMYGTLTRASNAPNSSPSSGNNNNNNNSSINNNLSEPQSQREYMAGGAGLMPPPPLPPPQESDYGTTGGARTGGRLIREIIV